MRETNLQNYTNALLKLLFSTFIVLISTSCEERKTSNHLNKESITFYNTHSIEWFSFTNKKKEPLEIQINHHALKVKHNNKPVVLLNLFNPNKEKSILYIKSLSTLKNTYKNKIVCINIPLEPINDTNLSLLTEMTYFIPSENKDFTKKLYNTLNLTKEKLNFLSVIYKNGKYLSHFEGYVLNEMIMHDIQKAIDK